MAERSDGRVAVEELLQFPTAFTFKAIGSHTREFARDVLEAAREGLKDRRGLESRTRLSRHGAYLSVTLTTRIDSAEQLRAVYAALRKVEGVITLL